MSPDGATISGPKVGDSLMSKEVEGKAGVGDGSEGDGAEGGGKAGEGIWGGFTGGACGGRNEGCRGNRDSPSK